MALTTTRTKSNTAAIVSKFILLHSVINYFLGRGHLENIGAGWRRNIKIDC
jgi:hypothetical protein